MTSKISLCYCHLVSLFQLLAKAVIGADGKVINLCDHVVYTVEKRYSVRIVIVVYNCLYKFLTFSKKQELFVAHFKPKVEPSV